VAHYVSGTNKLNYVDDSKSSGNYSDDIDDQASNNYDYDEIGNLISDDAEEIATIEWTVYGKIAGITRSGGSKPDLEYEYSPDGHRVSKKVIATDGNITITNYIRDAQGNTMSTYTRYIDTIASINNRLQYFYTNIPKLIFEIYSRNSVFLKRW
jgi:hypothetical protein